ncbi:hypothetical protein ACUXAV_006179 [Cupriavidus metallidurans]|uniref:Cu(II)/Cu(I) resistance protein CopM n=1 Tax=Cupriavidus TaxID=106589 RepID=UPI001267DB12|nr:MULTISPECIES: Cu(II)/Cu(I) resistance protein CopM [Cupriavidus]MDE4920236.1 Cu(II)/Cu(I) resistance protein CopM [Cupriavidus metallidurans]
MKSGMPLSLSVGAALCFAPGQVWAIQLAWVAETPAGLGIEGIKAERRDEGNEVQLLALAANPRHHSVKHVTPPKATSTSPERLEPASAPDTQQTGCQNSKRTRSTEPVVPQHSEPNAP